MVSSSEPARVGTTGSHVFKNSVFLHFNVQIVITYEATIGTVATFKIPCRLVTATNTIAIADRMRALVRLGASSPKLVTSPKLKLPIRVERDVAGLPKQ